MNNEYEYILEEEVNKYAMHYYEFYTRCVLQGKTDFSHHLEEVCNFDEEFYEGIVYSNDYFLEKMKYYEFSLYKKSLSNDKLEQELQRYNDDLINKVKEDFMKGFISFYLTHLNEQITENCTQIQHAVEDVSYYINRKYIGTSDVVSEEERLSAIKYEKDNLEKLHAEIECWREAKKEVELRHSVYA